MLVERDLEMRLASLVQTQVHEGNILPFQPSKPKARARTKPEPTAGAHVSINSTGNIVLVGSYNTVTINGHGVQQDGHAAGKVEEVDSMRAERDQ